MFVWMSQIWISLAFYDWPARYIIKFLYRRSKFIIENTLGYCSIVCVWKFYCKSYRVSLIWAFRILCHQCVALKFHTINWFRETNLNVNYILRRFEANKSRNTMGAAIAQWIRPRLPSCRPGFESQANHLSFYFIYSQICAIIVIVLWKERK